MEPAHIRLLNHQLISPQYSSPHDIVKWMGAMQAQEYRMFRWALGLRMKKPSMEAVKDDFDNGRIIRAHLFRTTWQIVAAEDYRWMLELCRKNNIRAVKGFLAYHGVSLTETEYERGNEMILSILQDKEEVTAQEIYSCFRESGMDISRHTASIYIRRAEFDGIVCNGSLSLKENTYTLTDKKITKASLPSREEAVTMLARIYFRSHGPATLNDFVWWSGLQRKEAKSGIEAIRSEFRTFCHGGEEFYLHQSSRTKGYRSSKVHLLPSYDEYLIGYKSRHIALAPEFRHRAHDNKGTFWPVVLKDGNVIGNWNITTGKKIDYELFGNDSPVSPDAMGDQMQLCRNFFGL